MEKGRRMSLLGKTNPPPLPFIDAASQAMLALLVVTLAVPAVAKEKKMTYDVPADVLLDAALTVARTHHVLTHVERSERLFSFSTSRSLGSPGFTCNAFVVEDGPSKSTLVINMKKNDLVWAQGAGGR